jgi:hypothetical protein
MVRREVVKKWVGGEGGSRRAWGVVGRKFF